MMHSTKISLAVCLALLVVTAGCGGKDAGTATGAPVRVTDVAVGRAIGGDKSISDSTDKFRATDTIYVSVTTDGTAPSAALRARWTFQDGQKVDESVRTIAPNGRERTEFHISKPDGWPAGKYKVEILLNDQSVGMKDFEVQPR